MTRLANLRDDGNVMLGHLVRELAGPLEMRMGPLRQGSTHLSTNDINKD